MHIVFALGDTVNKQVRKRQWRERPLWLEPWSMERPSAQNVIHAKAFNKVCEALNKVHNAKQTNWDLHVQAVLWAYRTVCKNLMTQASPRLEYEANNISPTTHEIPSSCMITSVDMTIHGTLEEEIQTGKFRLQELEKERVRLRKKSALVEVEVKKLEDEIKEVFLDKKTRGCAQSH